MSICLCNGKQICSKLIAICSPIFTGVIISASVEALNNGPQLKQSIYLLKPMHVLMTVTDSLVKCPLKMAFVWGL